MATHTFFGYAPDALTFDPGTGNVTLKPEFNASQDRVRFEITDDDNFADGDAASDEIGDDADQTANIFNADGSMAEAGQIYVEEVRIFEDADGNPFSVTVFEIDGDVVGYLPSEPLVPGENYTFLQTAEPGAKPGGQLNQTTRNNYETYENNSVVCFGPGTMIITDKGEMPVEWLDTSDLVLTRDNGFQPIVWIGRTKLPAGYFHDYPDEGPVCIPSGTLGPGVPTHDLQLTGAHRVLISSALAELYFFSAEVLTPAKAWADVGVAQRLVPRHDYTVTHILCAEHQIIAAQGAWVETMFTGREALRRLKARDRLHLENLFSGRLMKMHTARTCLSRHEASFLLRQIARASLTERGDQNSGAKLRRNRVA